MGSAVSSTNPTTCIYRGDKHNNTSAKIQKFALLCVLLAVATYSVESKKFYGYGAYGYGGVIAAPAYGYGLGGCIDTLSGCGGYVSLGYCGQAYYSNGCALSCGICKK